MLLIGLMSGTSADGIDAALVDITGEGRGTEIRLVHFLCVPHDEQVRRSILDLCDPATGSIPDFCALHFALGEKLAEAAILLANEAGVALGNVAAICCHGQTIWHQPSRVEIGGIWVSGTLQIGSPAIIAARTGCQVVSDFRAADMAAGGQGAPLVPYFDWITLSSDSESVAALNLGGIANVTFLPAGGDLDRVIAFDTGPGNVLIDALAAHYSDGARNYDRDGESAARGKVCDGLLDELLKEPFFLALSPKSTGRELFGPEFVRRALVLAGALALKPEDVLATLTELTARSIADALSRWLPPVDRVVVSGGGCHNRTLMARLRDCLRPASVMTFDAPGLPGDAKEAMAFALLGYETLHGRPSNVPSATGATRRVVLGSITPAL